MTVVTVTGHRDTDLKRTYDRYSNRFKKEEPSLVIQGMAAGTDLVAAVAAIDLHIPVLSVKPWTTHKPRIADRKTYAWVIANSWDVYVTTESETYPGAWCYDVRNRWMIDEGDEVWAWWTGIENGGTWNAIEYARKTDKKIVNLYEG